ncbi:MAG: DUF2203 domain-containing protein [Phycisphaeraceae bacterium]
MALEPVTASHAPKRGKKYFTVAEANRSLPYVGRVVGDIADTYKQAMALRERIDHPQPEDAQDKLRDGYDRTMDRLNDLVDELRQVGVELKDFEKGLVDFPAVHEGREVLLCWHQGEAKVTAWHEADAGYSGRQDVALLES